MVMKVMCWYCSFLPLTLCCLIYLAGKGSIFYSFFPLTYTLDLFAAALHVHNCTKALLNFDPQLLSVIVYVSIKSLFTIQTIQLKSVKVLKSWKIPTKKFCRSQVFNPQLPIIYLMHVLLNSIDADMKSDIISSREGGGLRL